MRRERVNYKELITTQPKSKIISSKCQEAEAGRLANHRGTGDIGEYRCKRSSTFRGKGY